MTPTCILINGPKGVGKDTAALAIKGDRVAFKILHVMIVQKYKALDAVGVDPRKYFDLFEQFKDTSFAELGGKTPRDIYIAWGLAKRAIDPNLMIKEWAQDVQAQIELGVTTILVPDVRFIEEFYAALPIFKPANVLLMRVYKTSDERWQDGLPFQGDIGSYFAAPPALWGHEERTLINDRPIEYYRGEAMMVGNGFIARRRIANSR